MITVDDVKNNMQVRTYIRKADESLGALGFTEHSFAHVTFVAERAGQLLSDLGYSEHEAELARIAGYLHDIGNIVNRVDHALSGAVMAFRLLDQLGMDPVDIATVISAIGHHDEKTAVPVNPVAAALMLADKCDVRRSRVRNNDRSTFDIHDRVNYAVTDSETYLSEDHTKIVLKLVIDTTICAVMDYFEIFLSRMLLCRKAAEYLKLQFKLIINGQEVL